MINLFSFRGLMVILLIVGLAGCEKYSNDSKRQEEHLHLVSFNVRYDDNPYDGINRWINRLPMVETYFKTESPDIIGLQEVFYNQLVDFRNMLPGYDYVGSGRNDGNRGGEHSPVFYKKSKFRAIDDGQFWLSETPDVPGSIGWDTDLPRIVTWVRLEHLASGKEIFCFNTHFPTGGYPNKARENSVLLMSDKMQEIAGDAPIFAMGDFNIRKGRHDNVYYDQLMDTFNKRHSLINSAYAASVVVSAGATANGFNLNWQATMTSSAAIDYIFVSDLFDVHSYRVDRAMDTTGKILISDHWPIVSKISFTY